MYIQYVHCYYTFYCCVFFLYSFIFSRMTLRLVPVHSLASVVDVFLRDLHSLDVSFFHVTFVTYNVLRCRPEDRLSGLTDWMMFDWLLERNQIQFDLGASLEIEGLISRLQRSQTTSKRGSKKSFTSLSSTRDHMFISDSLVCPNVSTIFDCSLLGEIW